MKKQMKKFKRYQEGGDVAADKQRGLDISNKEEPVGFFERIRMGNIDEPGSEAYNRFGAGRGRATAAPAAAPAAGFSALRSRSAARALQGFHTPHVTLPHMRVSARACCCAGAQQCLIPRGYAHACLITACV